MVAYDRVAFGGHVKPPKRTTFTKLLDNRADWPWGYIAREADNVNLELTREKLSIMPVDVYGDKVDCVYFNFKPAALYKAKELKDL